MSMGGKCFYSLFAKAAVRVARKTRAVSVAMPSCAISGHMPFNTGREESKTSPFEKSFQCGGTWPSSPHLVLEKGSGVYVETYLNLEAPFIIRITIYLAPSHGNEYRLSKYLVFPISPKKSTVQKYTNKCPIVSKNYYSNGNLIICCCLLSCVYCYYCCLLKKPDNPMTFTLLLHITTLRIVRLLKRWRHWCFFFFRSNKTTDPFLKILSLQFLSFRHIRCV